jgi:hypothetical protein
MGIVKVCKFLDSLGHYRLADDLFKLAKKENILDKRIYIPKDIKEIAAKAWKRRFKDIRFGNEKQFDLARKLMLNNYLELKDIMEIHKYTVDKRFTHSKNEKNPTYWEYQLHGGEEGRRWASDIIKIYMPKKWRVN